MINKEELQQELDLLLANRLIEGCLDGLQCIDWAISLMSRGLVSDYIGILASLEPHETYSIDLYFDRLIDDLHLQKQRVDKDLFHIYILDIAQRVVDNRLLPMQGLSILNSIGLQSFNYDFSTQIINQFTNLAEDISLLSDSYQLWYNGLTDDNIEETIIREMRLVILALSRGWNKVTNLIYCNTCNDFSFEKYQNKKTWYTRSRWICEKCKSVDFLAWSNVADQPEILEFLKK